jgi:hypothetical protein
MRKHKGPLVKIKTKNGRSVRYTRNEIGFTEVCALDETGKPDLPILKMDPQQQTGSIEFRSTSDSFSGGNASAGAAYGDDVYEMKMTWQRWRDGYLTWFANYLAD